jgi:hypothetical protein
MQGNHVIRIVTTSGDATEVFADTSGSDGVSQVDFKVGATLLNCTHTHAMQLDLGC